MMKRFWILPLLSVILIITPLVNLTPADGWEPLDSGIDYQEYRLDDPNNVYVARLDRHNPQVILDSGIAQGLLGHGPEKVSDMARRYDGAINSWGGTWGSSNKVVVAVNGSFFYLPSGLPMSGVITSGWYARRFDDLGGGSGFAWKMDRSVFIGKCVYHRAEKQRVTYLTSGARQEISGVNVGRKPDQLVLYTPQFGTNTATNPDGAEVVVELTAPAGILPVPDMITGTVRSVQDGQGASSIYFDEVVLSASGEARKTLLENAHVGDQIGISQEITHLQNDCVAPDADSWTDTYASINGSFELLLNGRVQHPNDPGATKRHPRTAIAYNDNYIYFIVVDGRSDLSIGMTIPELAHFAKDVLGATWGLAQDGGGSSTMVVNGIVVNHPSDPCPRIYLPLIRNENPGAQVVPLPGPPASSAPLTCERPVANSLMMIRVEPEEKSGAFTQGNMVRVSDPSAIRLGPGTNYTPLAVAPARSIGIVQPDLNSLDGVYAKGTSWWFVDFGRVTGWVDQTTIQAFDPLRMEFSPFR